MYQVMGVLLYYWQEEISASFLTEKKFKTAVGDGGVSVLYGFVFLEMVFTFCTYEFQSGLVHSSEQWELLMSNFEWSKWERWMCDDVSIILFYGLCWFLTSRWKSAIHDQQFKNQAVIKIIMVFLGIYVEQDHHFSPYTARTVSKFCTTSTNILPSLSMIFLFYDESTLDLCYLS
jgi:hypothetical protein